MATLTVAIKERIASIPSGVSLVCNNPSDVIQFNFDSEWDSITLKTARFTWQRSYMDVPFSGNTVNVPDISKTNMVELGVYADGITSTAVKIPFKHSIKSIGASAFENMYYLSSLTLPNTLTVIPDRMAAVCEKLSKITIPANVVSIGKEAFAGCTKFSSITFKGKNTLTTIGDSAFASTGLKKFAPPEGVTTIGAYVANTCNSLTSVVLPNSVTSVGEYAFNGCTKLSKVTLSNGMTSIPEGMFMGCKKLSAITIPASVTEIGDYAFEGCSSKLTITVTAGSYAEQWANENGYKVKVQKAK